MVKHSPAPWTPQIDHHNRNPRRRMALVATSNGRMSIDATSSGETYAQDCANARLIAAAPELLAALKEMLAQSDDPNARTGEFDTTAGRANRVVAKAEGR